LPFKLPHLLLQVFHLAQQLKVICRNARLHSFGVLLRSDLDEVVFKEALFFDDRF
jgi:hypothetical protein